MLFTTTINLPTGQAKVETVDWNAPGYEVCGFETVTTLASGESWGNGPEDEGETPLSLHMYAVHHLATRNGVGLENNWQLGA